MVIGWDGGVWALGLLRDDGSDGGLCLLPLSWLDGCRCCGLRDKWIADVDSQNADFFRQVFQAGRFERRRSMGDVRLRSRPVVGRNSRRNHGQLSSVIRLPCHKWLQTDHLIKRRDILSVMLQHQDKSRAIRLRKKMKHQKQSNQSINQSKNKEQKSNQINQSINHCN